MVSCVLCSLNGPLIPWVELNFTCAEREYETEKEASSAGSHHPGRQGKFTGTQMVGPGVAADISDLRRFPAIRVRGSSSDHQDPCEKLNEAQSPCRPFGDNIGHTAATEGCERHQERYGSSHSDHYCRYLPVEAGDVPKSSISTALVDNFELSLPCEGRIIAPPEGAQIDISPVQLAFNPKGQVITGGVEEG